MSDDHFIGEIRAFPFDFVPDGWMPCDGRELPIQQYQALYSIIGEKFGADRTKFKLPNLTGAAVVGFSRDLPFGQVSKASTDGTAASEEALPQEKRPYLAMLYCVCNDGEYPVRPSE